MTIVLPEGTCDAWQAAHQAANIGQWNDLGSDLLHCAAEEKDYAVRGDILTLALMTCQHACDLLPDLAADGGAAAPEIEREPAAC